MRLMNVVASGALLLTLVSCGDHSSSSSNRRPAVDQLITSANWKILLEGKSFPDKTMITVNDEVVVNECADKQTYFIDRESNPQSLSMNDYKVPSSSAVKIEVTDCDADTAFLPAAEVPFELSKNGNHAEIIIHL